jgi:hypothetical protein
VFFIAREALTNAFRHAEASEIHRGELRSSILQPVAHRQRPRI